MVLAVAKETGWSFHDIMWRIPASAIIQIYDAHCWSNDVELRWVDQDVDIDAILNGPTA